MKAIVNVNENWAIGNKGDLLFRFKEDMEHFKAITTGNIVVMGLNTLLSLPKQRPLVDRFNIVVADDVSRVTDNTRNFCYQWMENRSDRPDDSTITTTLTVHKNKDVDLKFKETELLVVNNSDLLFKTLLDLDQDEKVYVCGGASIYEQLLRYCDECIVTKNTFKGEGDTFFPNLDEDEHWKIVEETEYVPCKENPEVSYKFVTYKRNV